MLVKIYPAYRTIVAICDKELIGKKFLDGKKQIDLTGKFFQGEQKTKEEVIEIINDAKMEDATFNLVGKKSCSVAKELGLVNEKDVVYIDSIPVSMVLG